MNGLATSAPFSSPEQRQQRKRSSGPEESLTWALQALLVRHETYIAEAEKERSHLSSEIHRLENENKDLSIQNAELVDKNSILLEQVDRLTTAVSDSEAQITALTATVHSTQSELQKLAVLASRAEYLEAQLLQLEYEQVQLRQTSATTEEERRAISSRWQDAQRTVVALQEQVEAVEQDARQERIRHADQVQRLERRALMEKELNQAAMRLNAPAAEVAQYENGKGSEVISSFVKEILQDNANMQLKLLEQQDQLSSMSHEVASLKKHTLPSFDEARVSGLQSQALQQEWQPAQLARSVSQELHVHHHYHTPTATSMAATAGAPKGLRRSKKRTLTARTTTPMPRSPRSSPEVRRRLSSPSSVGTVGSLHNGRHYIPQKRASFSASSGPGSPGSLSYCPSTIFEGTFSDEDEVNYSEPTSPENGSVRSVITGSKAQRKLLLDVSKLESSLPLSQETTFEEEATGLSIKATGDTLTERHLVGPGSRDRTNTLLDKGYSRETNFLAQLNPMDFRVPAQSVKPMQSSNRHVHRTNSVSSLVSISGMDIHSSLHLVTGPRSKVPPLRHQPSNLSKTKPILTATTAEAMRSSSIAQHGTHAVGRALRETLGTSDHATATFSSGKDGGYTPLLDTFGRKVGGWLTSRWTSGDLRARAISDQLSAQQHSDGRSTEAFSQKTDRLAPRAKNLFSPESSISSPACSAMGEDKIGRMLVTSQLDEDALKECLGEAEGDVSSRKEHP